MEKGESSATPLSEVSVNPRFEIIINEGCTLFAASTLVLSSSASCSWDGRTHGRLLQLNPYRLKEGSQDTTHQVSLDTSHQGFHIADLQVV